LETHIGYENSRILNINNVDGFTDGQFPHCFNVWFKLSSIALGSQPILEYGGDTSIQSKVIFDFIQVGSTDQFIPNITTRIDSVKPQQVVTLPAITRNEWYFISHSRDTVNKTTSTSINGGAFITQSYTDEMEILYLHRVRLLLGGVSGTNDVSNQSQSSIGNFSLFNHILSLKDVKSIYDFDKNLNDPEIIVEPTRDIRKPPLSSGLTIDFNFNEEEEDDPRVGGQWRIATLSRRGKRSPAAERK
jgi:hypothetical protein